MKVALLAGIVGLSLASCTSIEEATVSNSEIAAKGEAIAVIQASSIGFTALLNNVVIVDSSLDQVVNKLLVAEAKAMGANKVELLHATTSPGHGIFALPSLIIGFPSSQATGIAIK